MQLKTLVLRREDLAALLARVGPDAVMDRVVAALEVALQRLDLTRVQLTPRRGFEYGQPEFGLTEWMPICDSGTGTTIKIVGYHPGNPANRGLPSVLSLVGAFDIRTGRARVVADATFLTAVRTGAASALASRVLADPRSRTLVLIGCGAQAVTQVHALTRVLPIQNVLAYDVDPTSAASLPARLGFLSLAVEVLQREELANACAQADMLVTCTSCGVGQGPVVPAFQPQPHLHINAVGSDFPGKTELPPALLAAAQVFPDYLEQALAEGECQQLELARIGPDLATLVREPTRFAEHRSQVSVFDSTGWALEDHVALQVLLDYARHLGLGVELELSGNGNDPKDPYDLGSARADASAPPELDTNRRAGVLV